MLFCIFSLFSGFTGGKKHFPVWMEKTQTVLDWPCCPKLTAQCQPEHMPEGHHIKHSLNRAGDEDLDELNKSKEGKDHFLDCSQMAFPSCVSTEGSSYSPGASSGIHLSPVHANPQSRSQLCCHLFSVSVCARARRKSKVIKKAVWLNKGAHYVCYFCSSNACLPLFPLRFPEKSDKQGWGLLSASIRQINLAGDGGRKRGELP